jgi:dipeptidyl aminopeptidase/acylaminoacyl peptidase
MKSLSTFLLLLPLSSLFSQKKIIDHTAYRNWNKIESQVISKDGNYISYVVKPLQGDGYLYIYHQKTDRLDSVSRGYDQQFSGNSNFLAFKIAPSYDTLRKCELGKIEKEKWPKDSLGIYTIKNDSLIKMANVKKFSLPEEGDWLAYLIDGKGIKTSTEKKKKEYFFSNWWHKRDSTIIEEYKSDGKTLFFLNPINLKKKQHKDVVDFVFSDKGKYVAFTIHEKQKKANSYQLGIFEVASNDFSMPSEKKSAIKSMVFDHSENTIALLSSKDTTKKKQFELVLFDLKAKKWEVIADTTNTAFDKNRGVSEHRSLLFSENDQQLFFGVADRVKQEPKDTLLESEKAKLDLWHYQDKRLQPQQLAELWRDAKKSDLFVYHLGTRNIVQLSNDTLQIRIGKKQKGDYLFAYSTEDYESTYNWTSPNLEDHYRVSLQNGKADILKKAVGFGGTLSPSGKWYTYFNGAEGEHYVKNVDTKREVCITCSRKDVRWEVDQNGMPQLAEPYGIVGWFKGEDEILIQSQYDLWTYSVTQNKLYSYTHEEGKDSRTRLSIQVWDRDSLYLEKDNLLIKGFDETTKGNGFYRLENHLTHTDLKKIYYTDHDIVSMERAKNGNGILFRKGSLINYPDLFLTDDSFSKEKQVSKTNPQQSEYNWATVELTKWINYDGVLLEGLIYKPEDFDPSKSYPMIVYFYELYGDQLHNHYAPKPSASIVYPTEFASAGYIVFIPDIRYRVGHPAKSAYDCIMSGTDHVLKLHPNIDSKRMGLQGQSWGGYQTAMMITLTNRYVAAMAGAPVSNMFSAYGGIRWGSGLNRQFQYERQQSRIGKTIWEAPELYIENSPIFHLPKVTTPLMILANDDDGAVPWYQGIELFTDLKRLGKPCWMLNYNGDNHNIMKTANRLDFSVRLRQYFDYYLQNKPAPSWLLDGIPAVVKGEEYRLEIKEK